MSVIGVHDVKFTNNQLYYVGLKKSKGSALNCEPKRTLFFSVAFVRVFPTNGKFLKQERCAAPAECEHQATGT